MATDKDVLAKALVDLNLVLLVEQICQCDFKTLHAALQFHNAKFEISDFVALYKTKDLLKVPCPE